jgi:spermidine synthase
MRLPLAAAGLTAIIGQVLLMRELAAVFYGNELVYGLALAIWMLWVAAGAWLGRHLARPSLFAVGLPLAAATLPAGIAFVRGVRPLVGIAPGAFVGLETVFWTALVALAPICLLSGALFSLGARLLAAQGEEAGRAYVYESLGSMAGGALFSFLLVPLLNPFQVALLIAGVDLGVVVWSSWSHTGPQRSFRVPLLLGAAACLACLTLFVPLGEALHEGTLDWSWPHRVLAADSRYGRLIITALDGQRAFFQDGRLAFETQSTFPEEVAHLPLLAHPDPRRVLLVGGGVDGTLREILKHPVESVQYVELDPLFITAAREHLPPSDAAVLDDPRVQLVLGDGRRVVKESEGTFDLAILSLPEPATGQLNRFYTREFFSELKDRMAPGALLSLGLPSAENYWSADLTRRNAGVYQTLRAVFADVIVTPGDVNFYLASDRALDLTPALLSARLLERGVETRWVTAAYLDFILAGGRYAQVNQGLAAETRVQLNRDLAPICYYYDMLLWLSRFYGQLGSFFRSDAPLRAAWLLLPLAAAILLLGRRCGWNVPAVVAISGFSGMTIQVVVILAFQSLHGYVYGQLGLIIAAAMGGMALGAWGAELLGWRGSRIPWLSLTQALLALFAVALPPLFSRPLLAPAALFPPLALVAGALGGAIFAQAVTKALPGVAEAPPATGVDPGRVAGTLYAVDLVGGCLGAVVAAGFLVPLLGIPRTCVLLALLNLMGSIFLFRPRSRAP